ncbi:unnamed protein product [Psylliodes chrysocephalus]|uniref:MADF domain-containing protein n=1 Tax=Psylliodes chrysocephalus TaxID=3402493 RepID=A0A9P0GJQ2_9CUCU|nr:unnamed protein product [Psylliodes chrysocephala]
MDKEKLINCVFVREPIWNKRHKSHHNSLILSKLWKEIADECGQTVSIVKSHWKRLRETFMKKFSEIPYKRSGDGAEENDSEKLDWIYFDSLLFLKDQMIPRKSSENFHEGEEESELTEMQEELIERHSVSDDESRSNTITTLSPRSTPLPSPSAPVPKKLKTKCRNVDSIGEGMLKAEEEKVAYLKLKKEMRQAKELKEIDEDEAFFKCILPHVR